MNGSLDKSYLNSLFYEMWLQYVFLPLIYLSFVFSQTMFGFDNNMCIVCKTYMEAIETLLI